MISLENNIKIEFMDNKFISVFIDNLVRTFRSYNKDYFTITISYLKKKYR